MKKFAKIGFLFLFGFGVLLGPVSTIHAQVANPVTGETDVDYTDRLQDCNPLSGNGFVACWVKLFYYLVLYPTGWFASVTAQLLDFSIAYSLDSNSYSQDNGGFINQGWGIIRDIANVSFIFILLYIAIRHILNMGSSHTKKLLTSLIIAALLINFSLFFSKVIIDAGNILARAFYNNIEVTYDDQTAGEGVKSISQALASKVSPQKLLGSELFRPPTNPTVGEPLNQMPNGYAFFIMLVAAFVNVTMGIIFLSTFLLFIGRVVGLWFMMIFSPIAFASVALPDGSGFLGQFGWHGWRDSILKLSFMAPIFLFFLFLTIMFLSVILGSQSVLSGNADTTHRLAGVLIPFAVIIVLLRQSKKVAQDLSGEFGKGITGAFGKLASGALAVTGVGAGLVIGTAAMAGRKFVGGAATRELASGENQRNVAKYTKMAKAAEDRGDAAAAWNHRQAAKEAAERVSMLKRRSESSFDVRRSEFLQKQVLGSKLGKLTGSGLQNLGSETFGGEKLKLDFGKGKDTSIAKQESEKKKKVLEEAKLYDTGAQNEQNLALIGYAARKGLGARDEVIEHLDRYTEQIRNDESLTRQERNELFREIYQMRRRANSANTDDQMRQIISGFQRVNGQGNGVVDDQGRPVMERGTDAIAKAFAKEAKDGIADVIEARLQPNSALNPVLNFYDLNSPTPRTKPDYSSVVADEIRKGPKKDMDKTLKELIDESNRNNNQPPPPGGGGGNGPNPNPNVP